jgi:FdhE protein
VRIGGDTNGYRYLQCSLCSAQWHMVRIKCSACQSTKGIGYQALEALPGHALPAAGASPGVVQAETCDSCGSYLKIVHMDKDPMVEPIADDLATITLDLLVSEAGYHRQGANLMLLFGADEEAPPDPPAGRGSP